MATKHTNVLAIKAKADPVDHFEVTVWVSVTVSKPQLKVAAECFLKTTSSTKHH
jgi:hypothetical protein